MRCSCFVRWTMTILWDAETADHVYEGAIDAFAVENGKITAHFFSGKITPKAAAKT